MLSLENSFPFIFIQNIRYICYGLKFNNTGNGTTNL